ncbi:SAP30-binding protein [Dioscorea alata]|uniref:SAP30-binding protein n=1 Tax=Dioscorea alata TaxID=55571 RepID=A0ACB7TU01_DIOAL|nr:SAP30-binding protein [Dioscorea alata]
MASQTEGIALLSMYNDEEDDDEEPAVPPAEDDGDGDGYGDGDAGGSKEIAAGPAPLSDGTPTPEPTPPVAQSRTPLGSDEDPDYYKSLRSPTPPPLPKIAEFQSQPTPPVRLPSSSPSPAPPVLENFDGRRAAKGSVAIVDYAHDEMALSPEPEDEEIGSGGRVLIESERPVSDGNSEGTTPSGAVCSLPPTGHSAPPLSSDLPEHLSSNTMDYTVTEPEVSQDQLVTVASTEMQIDVDSLNSFLPPPLTIQCPEELQDKINKFLVYKKAGKSFNADLRNRKDYRNPDFLQHAVRYQEIDQIGTCFSKDVFDPHGYDKSDYFDEIEADMKRELERKEQERKKAQKVDFVPGGTQTSAITQALKISAQIPGVVAPGLQSLPMAVDVIAKDTRQNKKSKWDKVDGDVKNPPLSGAQDNLSAVGVHAAHLSAANAGAGYTAFAQQKRREAEDKRSSERKFERRS